MAPAATDLRIDSGEVTIAAREHSPAGPGRPTVVLVHGYPDQQQTWDTLVARLPLDDWHVVTYDVRGAGASTAPSSREGYLTTRLVDDLVAVLDRVLPDGERVHLVGHDWGSAQLWDAVVLERDHPGLRGRVASYTSVSGPSLDHVAWLTRRPRGRRLALLRQLGHSWYIGYFCLPLLPDLAWRFGHERLGRTVAARERLPRDHFGTALSRNAINGLGLYRDNVLRRPRTRAAHTDVPVLVVQPDHDAYVTDVFLQDLDVLCSDVRTARVDGGHWCIVTHADQVAALVERHVREHA
jgi:pimeloyl-ACP methyl ester carboxylesterase